MAVGRSPSPSFSMPLPHSHSLSALRRCRRVMMAALSMCVPVGLAAQNAVTADSAVSEPRDPRPFAAWSNSAMSMRDSVVAVARSQIGTRYRFGGTTPTGGFDCSGFVRYVLSAFKVALPRTAAQQAAIGADVPKDTTRLQPGDLLTFGKGKLITHIGIYVGDGRYVHASPKAGRVIETSLGRTESPLVKIWRGGRRLLLADGGVLTDSTAIVTP